jgi:hypothetical protein
MYWDDIKILWGPPQMSLSAQKPAVNVACPAALVPQESHFVWAGEIAWFKPGTASSQSGVATHQPPLQKIHSLWPKTLLCKLHLKSCWKMCWILVKKFFTTVWFYFETLFKNSIYNQTILAFAQICSNTVSGKPENIEYVQPDLHASPASLPSPPCCYSLSLA